MISALLMAFSAFCYRLRGSEAFSTWPLWFFGVARGDRLIKLLIGAVPVGMALLFFVPWWAALAAALATAGIQAIDGHANGEGLTGWGDALKLADAGAVCSVPPLAALLLWHAPWIVALAALAGFLAQPAAYLIGWHLPSIGTTVTPWWRRLITGTEWGEFLTGALRLLFVVMA